MTIRVGDIVFSSGGRPGVVTGRDPNTAELVVQREGEKLEAARRKGVINGLTEEQRVEFDKVMDAAREKADPRERVDLISGQIEKLREDPRNHVVTRYLQGEMAHIMNSERIVPREYRIAQDSIR